MKRMTVQKSHGKNGGINDIHPDQTPVHLKFFYVMIWFFGLPLCARSNPCHCVRPFHCATINGRCRHGRAKGQEENSRCYGTT
jgi:hypothetical protein